MEQFIVSARKYRPATFDTVIGQQAITSTLKNAIRTNHVAQAFLFCGPRGVGKTTCARIFAKTINCFNPTQGTEPCDTCESCTSFNEGHSLNIYELDAASNNSVDDIRNLIDMVRYPPQIGTRKVYIIDEVHMLSQAAFNAFLKTLEEPPKHAIFILATTEKHKILPTILSRCQVFDFQRITPDDTAAHLASIAQQEGITAEADALHIIAQKADGALRDALSIFDQVVSFCGNNITYQSVIENLNVLDVAYYFKLTQYFLEGNISQSLLSFNEILQKGFDAHNFINGLAVHFRNLLVGKNEATVALFETSQNIKEKYKQQAAQCSDAFILRALDLLKQCDVQYKASKNQRLFVEVTLMQLASLQHTSSALQAEKKNDINILPPNKEAATSPLPAATSLPVAESKTEYTAGQVAQPVQPTAPKAEQISASTPIPANKPAVSRPTSGFSIKKNQASTGPKTSTPELLEGKENNPFTPEALQEVWDELTNQFKTNNRIALFTAFSVRKPSLKSESNILLTIDNKAQEEEIKAEKITILNLLRSRLKNYSIQLEIEINKEPRTRKAYTPAEKFAELAEQNPALINLKNKLDLDFNITRL